MTGLEDDAGSVAQGEEYAYDPFGEIRRPDGVTGPSSDSECSADEQSAGMSKLACSQPFRFEGFYYDSGVKTYDMQARAYRPDIGRFLTTDRFES